MGPKAQTPSGLSGSFTNLTRPRSGFLPKVLSLKKRPFLCIHPGNWGSTQRESRWRNALDAAAKGGEEASHAAFPIILALSVLAWTVLVAIAWATWAVL